jgi:hypothetical protein
MSKQKEETDTKTGDKSGKKTAWPTTAQKKYLTRGLNQAGGKLPLFDEIGQEISPRTIKVCIEHGWAEQWFPNPIKPNWLVCKLTAKGRQVIKAAND